MQKLIFVLYMVSAFSIVNAQTKNFIDQPYIEVAGAVDTLITPDEIFIKIIISERDTRDKTSVEEQEDKMVAVLKAAGINTEKDLTTSDMASNFHQYIFKGKEVLKSKEYSLKVSNAAAASKVFMQLEALDISNTSIDHVEYSQMEQLKNFMRSKAVENAKARAVALTKPLNQAVGAAINIIDNENYNVDGMLQGKAAGVVVVGYSTVRQQQEPPKIEYKKINVTTNVNVKFILK